VPTRTAATLALDRLREPRVAVAWLALAVWVGIVWWLGTSGFGSVGTSRYLVPALRWLLPDLRLFEIYALAAVIRDCMHPTVYGVLAGLAYRAFRVSGVEPARRAAVLAGALSLAVAICDETRQGVLVARTGSLWDVGLDASGAAVVLAIALAVAARRSDRPLP